MHESLIELAESTTESCGVKCVVQMDGSVSMSDAGVETHLYRIAQEAVNNAIRHARASYIEIAVSSENGMLQLMVADDGTWKEPAENLRGIGL
ncbi:sensor histidine kinase [Pontiella sulfatireligans]|uniref:sensor histidine kinase n=1 Tax=Pontiella sulfatireligans TaxID=2750658 RepID=UPI0014443EFB|nr:ATP-binding protein [Pontiella sulfatireligans]